MRTGIALGSNLGDRLANLQQGRDVVSAIGTGSCLVSRVYETEPVGCGPGSPAYLNAVVEIEFDGNPAELLSVLQNAETEAGRPAARLPNSPRTLDLDILYCGDRMLSTPRLTLPHPRLHERRFVLAPLHDIRPDLILPGQASTIDTLLKNLPAEPRARIHVESL